MNRRTIPTIFTVVFLVLALALPSGARAGLEEGASAFIRDLADEAVQSLTGKDVSRDERIKRFRQMFRNNFAVRSIGKFALGRIARGRSWRNAGVADKNAYFQTFEDHVVISYVDRFARYAGEKLQVTKARTENQQILTVFSKIERAGGVKPIRIHWQLATNGKIFKVLDVFIEGASMSKTFQDTFGAIYRNEGRSMAGLLDAIRTKTAEMNARADQ